MLYLSMLVFYFLLLTHFDEVYALGQVPGRHLRLQGLCGLRLWDAHAPEELVAAEHLHVVGQQVACRREGAGGVTKTSGCKPVR